MPVAFSRYELDAHAQADGRVYVRETHEITEGEPITFDYLASPGADHDAILAARSALIDEQLAQAEFSAVLGGA